MKKLLFSAFIATSLFACKSETKAPFDLANAKKEIEAANQEVSNFMAKGDSVGLASCYGTDGALLLNNMPAVKGQANLVKAWGGFINSGIGAIELNTTEVWGDENYITEDGTYVLKAKDGTQLDKGKYLVLWKKENGKWKFHRDISNSDLPIADNK
jgi:ketosteroid isomerase-like protein